MEEVRPDAVVADILTLAPALAAELSSVRVATLIPHVHPALERGMPCTPSARDARARSSAERLAGDRTLMDHGLRVGATS